MLQRFAGFRPIFRSQLNPEERRQLRSLLIRDTVALASTALTTIVLAVATYLLFQSYTTHQRELGERWFARGQKALRLNQPQAAINAFHSALLYAPGQRQMEVALASALASAGRIQEATAYFNTLWEAEPGNGEINVQLARLSARSNNEELAKHYYHAAIYGNWEGDGYVKRRDTRLELVRFLVSKGLDEQARSELLLAAGNAPESDIDVRLVIAGLMVEDHALADALALYRQILAHSANNVAATEGAAQMAYALGNYTLAHHYYLRAVSANDGNQDLARAGTAKSPTDEDMLKRVSRILVLDPSPDLPVNALAARLLDDREIARERLSACPASADALASIRARWTDEPKRLTDSMLANDPELQTKETQLIFDTEKITASVCNSATGDDAILLRLAEVPPATGPAADHE